MCFLSKCQPLVCQKPHCLANIYLIGIIISFENGPKMMLLYPKSCCLVQVIKTESILHKFNSK